MEEKKLNAEIWRNLLRLTGENITADKLSVIMMQILGRPDDDIFSLTLDQAQRLLHVFQPLPKLRKVLWEKAVVYVGPDVADSIVAAQLDELAIIIVRDADMSLFPGSQFDKR